MNEAKTAMASREQELHNLRVHRALAHARRRLLKASYSELRRVTCIAHGDVLHLEGEVSRFHLKQMAQHVVCNLEGFEGIENRITVSDRFRCAS